MQNGSLIEALLVSVWCAPSTLFLLASPALCSQLLVSGGVDSTVCAALLHKALNQDQVIAVHIDNGFMRKHESLQVEQSLRKIGLKLRGEWGLRKIGLKLRGEWGLRKIGLKFRGEWGRIRSQTQG